MNEELIPTAAPEGAPAPEETQNPEPRQQEPRQQEPQQQPEATDPPEPAETPPPSETQAPSPSVEALIAEAEQRGYLRGRNESIERLMRQPGPLERDPDPQSTAASSPDDTFLSAPRISIWDR